MEKFNALILGTDSNSYSVARSFYEAFSKKAIVAGSAVLVPFVDSKIADINTKKNFSTDDDVFVKLLNKIGKKHKDEKLVFFVPTEEYMSMLLKNIDRLEFDFEIPYPNKEMGEKLIEKSNFYKLLDKNNIIYPKTQLINKDNLDQLELDGDLFLKADDYSQFLDLDLKNKKKGYKIKSKQEAIDILKEIFEKGYDHNMIVQEYINGVDGSEYSLNGYRANDGKVSMTLARNLLSDHRDMWVGNHLVQIDYDDEEFYEIAKKIVEKIDYYGLFNFDFKKDSKTGKIYCLEMNVRQGRTFYYTNLSGVNLIELAIKDKVFGESYEKRPDKKFMLKALSDSFIRENINKDLLDDFNERLSFSQNPLINDQDDSRKRRKTVEKSIIRREKQIENEE